MRLRKHYKNYKRSDIGEQQNEQHQMSGALSETIVETKEKIKNDPNMQEHHSVKQGKSVGPLKMLRQLMKNPNFNMQLMVILLSLTSDNIQMEQRIDGMTNTIDKVRSITELVNNGMSSMKVVSEVPKNIRRLLK